MISLNCDIWYDVIWYDNNSHLTQVIPLSELKIPSQPSTCWDLQKHLQRLRETCRSTCRDTFMEKMGMLRWTGNYTRLQLVIECFLPPPSVHSCLNHQHHYIFLNYIIHVYTMTESKTLIKQTKNHNGNYMYILA